jgi:hypothetical protein
MWVDCYSREDDTILRFTGMKVAGWWSFYGKLCSSPCAPKVVGYLPICIFATPGYAKLPDSIDGAIAGIANRRHLGTIASVQVGYTKANH